MAPGLLPVDPALLTAFDSVVDVHDPLEMDIRSRVSERLFEESRMCGYRLQDHRLLRSRFDDSIMTLADRRLGSMLLALCGNRFAAEGSIGGEGIDSYSFSMTMTGSALWKQGRTEISVARGDGAAFRLSAGTRMLSTDNNARRNLWIAADALEHALEGLLGERLRKPLEFRPDFDWNRGLAGSLNNQLDALMRELPRRDGMADNPVGLASFTDLILSLVLHGIPHNYQDRLDVARAGAVPAYVRRAEEFMRANAAAPLRMQQVAEAAGCSVRSLEAVFRRFRNTTPLAALHLIRLQQVQAELRRGPVSGSPAEVARRYGFTNAGRFAAAYRRRFGEAPSETARRGGD